MICSFSSSKLVVVVVSGDCASAGNLLSFLAATRANLGNTIIGLLRADSGFFADEILKVREDSGTDYVVAAKLHEAGPGKVLSLFKDDPDMKLWCYGVVCATLKLSALEVWRAYRGRADGENRIKELKADFGLENFNLRDFWATEAALTAIGLVFFGLALRRFRSSLTA